MTERRSMTQALVMSPEQVQFIRGTDTAQESVPIHAEGAGRNLNQASDAAAHSPVQGNPHHRELDRPTPAHRELPAFEPLVPLTTRLSASIAEALRRAHLEQKLHRRAPATQQEIVEEALLEWLTSRHFLT